MGLEFLPTFNLPGAPKRFSLPLYSWPTSKVPIQQPPKNSPQGSNPALVEGVFFEEIIGGLAS